MPTRSPFSKKVLLALVAFGILSIIFGRNASLKTQLLSTPETIQNVKLVRQNGDKVSYDIYYEGLISEEPEANITIIIANALLHQSGRFSSMSRIVDSALLTAGSHEISSSGTSQIVKITGITRQATTKLGTLMTPFKPEDLVSIEYDVLLRSDRYTIIDPPLPQDFPVNYQGLVNPVSETLFVQTPDAATILSGDEKLYTKAGKIPFAAMLLANVVTTMQQIENLNRANLISEPARLTPPPLIMEQHQLQMPQIEQQNFNTLMIRYRGKGSRWMMKSFFLPATSDVTLPVPAARLLDFYAEVEYAFAQIGGGFHTLALDFPAHSLLKDQYPAFYRTDFQSLVPELQKDRQGLTLDLHITIPLTPETLAVSVLTREPLRDLPAAVNLLSQFQPVALHESSSTVLKTAITTNSKGLFLNLIGKHNQIWSQRISGNGAEFLSPAFRNISLPKTAESVPDPDLINTLSGDRLLCFIRSQRGSFSLPVIQEEIMFGSSCLESARRQGFREGMIFPIAYRSKVNILEALRSFVLDPNAPILRPEVKMVDQKKKIIALVSTFQGKKSKLMISASPDFSAFSLQSTELIDKNTLKLPTLPSCEVSCYVKILSVIREDNDIALTLASDTVLISGENEENLQLCFFNQAQVDPLYKASELKFQILRPTGEPLEMIYSGERNCYEISRTTKILPDPSKKDTSDKEDTKDEVKVLFESFTDLITKSEEYPENTLIFHTNGFSSSHITIPPQRHYLLLKPNTKSQLLLTNLVFEHGHFQGKGQEDSVVLKRSYLISLIGKEDTISYQNSGNILLFTRNEKPYFLETLPVAPPINETLLFPGGKRVLQIPNVIRMLPPDDVLIQGFDKGRRSIVLPLLVPERSDVKIFLDHIFRPGVEAKQTLSEGILFDPKTRLLNLHHPKGLIPFPLVLRKNVATDERPFSKTFPPTAIPSDLAIFSYELPMTLEIGDPKDIPTTSILFPELLPQARAGKSYEEKVALGGIESAKTFEIFSLRFMSETCRKMFTFDKEKRILKGNLPGDTKLEGCLFELFVRYLITTPIGDQEVKTIRVYGIPILSVQNSLAKPVIKLEQAIDRNSENINQVLSLPFPLDEIYETNAEYTLKGTDQGLISKVEGIGIVVDRSKSQLQFSGSAKNLLQRQTVYMLAIRRDTGTAERIELMLLPIRKNTVEISIIKGFSEKINTRDLLQKKGYTSGEIATARVMGLLDVRLFQDLSDGYYLIQGEAEVVDRTLTLLILKNPPPKTGFETFDSRVQEKVQEKFEQEETLVITFKLSEPEKIKSKSITLRGGKFFTLDLSPLLPSGHVFSLLPMPDFLKSSGMSLSGTAPKTAQVVEIVVKDSTARHMIVVPIQILQEEKVPDTKPSSPPSPTPTPASPPVAPPPDTVSIPPSEPSPPTSPPQPPSIDSTLKKAAETISCFPDIADLSIVYQKAICRAKEFGIISGSGGYFKPHDPINRAEVAKILIAGPLVLMQVITKEEIPTLAGQFSETQFSDVPITAWFFGFVQVAYESEIVNGNPDGTYRPANFLNVAEAGKLIIETIRSFRPEAFSGEESLSAVTFPHEPWFFPYIRLVALSGGDYPEPEDLSDASLPIQRGEFIFNLMAVLQSRVPSMGMRSPPGEQ